MHRFTFHENNFLQTHDFYHFLLVRAVFFRAVVVVFRAVVVVLLVLVHGVDNAARSRAVLIARNCERSRESMSRLADGRLTLGAETFATPGNVPSAEST